MSRFLCSEKAGQWLTSQTNYTSILRDGCHYGEHVYILCDGCHYGEHVYMTIQVGNVI